MKKILLMLLLLTASIVSLHAQQYKLCYNIQSDFMYVYQTWITDPETGESYQSTATDFYKTNQFKIWAYTFQVIYTSGATQDITITPATISYTDDELLTYAGMITLTGGVPKEIRFKSTVGLNSGNPKINSIHNEIVYTYNSASGTCSMNAVNYGNSSGGGTNYYYTRCILNPTIYYTPNDDQPINVSGVATACGGETVSLKGSCFFEQNYSIAPRIPGHAYNENNIWEVTEDFQSFRQINKYTTQIAVDENDYNDPAKKYGYPRYYRVRIGPYVSSWSTSVTFKKGPPIPQIKNGVSPLCAGEKGSIVLSDFRYPDGSLYTGQEALNYSIKLSTGFPSPNIRTTNTSMTYDNLDPGSYEVAITTDGGCVQKIPFTINPAPAALTLGSVPSCVSGVPAITLNGGGGKGGLQYSMDNGNTFSTNNFFSNLSPGTTYQAVVIDDNRCTKTVPVTTQSAISLTATTADPGSPGGADGSITISPAGGAGAPYQYSLDQSNWQGSNVFSGLAQGTYTVWALDKFSCGTAAALPVTLTDPAPVIVNGAVTEISCNGLADGSITISTTGGVPPFTYSSDGNTFLSINSFYDLGAGSHTFWARDSKGNTGSMSMSLTMPAVLNISISGSANAVCKGIANGAITVVASGGTGAYQYQLNSNSYQPSPAFNVGAGQYTVTVADAHSCHATTLPVNISEPAQYVTLSSVTQAVSCNGGSNGVVTVTAGNGVPPYQYKSDISNWQTATAIGGFPAGTYTITAMDDKGCTGIQTGVTISEPPALQIALSSKTDALCYGASNGTITVTSAGGTGNIRYYLNTAPTVPNSSGVFTGLPAGTYVVSANDDNNCVTPLDVVIGQPVLLELQPSVTNVSCFGQANGKVVVSGTGGTAPYSYAADNINFNGNGTFDLLLAGNYTWYVKDDHGCRANVATTVTQPTVLAFTVAVDNALCNGSATGIITVTPSGGTSPYTYNTDGNTFQSSDVLTGITAGTHGVSVMDAQGCIKTNSSVFVGEPTALTLQITNQQTVSCNGGNDGSLTLQAGGGTAPYQYKVNGGVYQSSNTISMLSANTYTVSVKDAKGCTYDISGTVTQPLALSLQVVNKTDILCAGDASGDLTLQAAGGVGNYLYSFEGAAYQSNGYYNHLSANTYAVTVKDANQCTGNFNATLINLYQPLTAALTAVAPPTCADKGTITVSTVQGGLSPYSYSLDNTAYVSNPLFSNLYNGDYTVYIKDNNGCIITRSISPYGPVSIRGAVQLQPVSCKNGSNGRIQVINITGGNNTYEYSLDNISYQSSATFNNLPAHAYQVYVRDIPYSCQAVISTAVTEPDALQLRVINNKAVSCFDGSDGAIQLQASGGVGSNTFTIDGGNPNSSGLFSGLAANSYTIQLTDANACTVTWPVSVTQPALLTAAVTSAKDISCYGNGNGEIIVAGGGGITPYTYSMDGTLYQSSASFNNLQKGDYTIQIKDNNGCLQPVTAHIAEPAVLTLDIVQATDILCYGASTGAVEVSAAGGIAQYAFALNNLSPQVNGNFGNLPAGDYLLSVTDVNNCITRQPLTLSQPERLTLNKQFTAPSCSYVNDGSMVVTVNGGVTPYNYSWNNGGTSSEIDHLGGGVYAVTVTDAHSCMLQDSALLVQPDVMVINVGFRDTVLCVGQTINISADNPGAQYSWTSDAGFSDDKQIVAVNKDGHYFLTVTTPAGCVAKDSFNVQTSLTALTASFLLSSYGVVGDTVIIIDVSNPKPAITDWTMPAGARDVGSAAGGAIHQLLFDQTGEYTVKMQVRLGECSDMTTKTIKILPKGQNGTVDSLLGYREQVIQTVTAYPNPTDGQFKVRIKLSKSADIQLRLINFNTGNVEELKTAGGADNYEIQFNADRLPQGIYLVALQSGTEYKVIRILKM
jgi:uncharacterized protein (DUF2141 family)